MEETFENIQTCESTPQRNDQATDNLETGDSTPQSNLPSISIEYFADQETQLHPEELEAISVKSDTLSEQEVYKEVAIQSVDLNVACCSNAPFPISLLSKSSKEIKPTKECSAASKVPVKESRIQAYDSKMPIIIINSSSNRSPITIQPTPGSTIIQPTRGSTIIQPTQGSTIIQPTQGSTIIQPKEGPITIQPSRTFPSLHSLLSPMSLVTSMPNQPQSLFLQALAILNQSSIVVNRSLQSARIETEIGPNSALNTPDSLTSAPPSYSFVLRQTAAMARRRPRHMGTFIPSPSFVTKTPPPNYAQAFDIYVDTPVRHHHRHRVNYTFSFAPMPVICPECGYTGLTTIQSKITLCTHLCALLLCLFCCWICAPLPYIMSSCKDVYHYCTNCNALLGMYSPSNPEPTYTIR